MARNSALLPLSLVSLSLLLSFSACSTNTEDGADVDAGDGDGDYPGVAEACGDLGKKAGWVPGRPATVSASSTEARIRAQGEETWTLALTMLSVVQPTTLLNVANSPTSMFAALGMNYGRYEEEECGLRIADVLNFTETGSDLHNTLGASLSALESRSFAPTESQGGLSVTLEQSVWTFSASEAPPSTQLQAYYGASQNALGPPGEAAREFLNCYVEQQSEGLLKEFFAEGKPRGDTSTYDLNVSVLTGAWDMDMSVQPVEFTDAAGKTATRDGFGASATGAFYDGADFTSFDVPLSGGEVSVLFVLPKDEDPAALDAFADALSAEDLAEARALQAHAVLEFSMPKLLIEAPTIDYNPLLGFACPPFTLRDVLHNAAVSFDEKGIKAAAATAAETWDDGGGPPEPSSTFHLDRPFLFFAYDRATTYVLFSGRYLGES